jgi:hypothetical protein
VISLFRAELRKVFSLRVWWILLVAMLAWVGLLLAGSIFTAGLEGLPERTSAEFAANIWPSASGGLIFALVIGVLSVTGEFQHRTATTTFLVRPRRHEVVAAKLLSGVVVGLFYGVAATLVNIGAVVPAILSAGGSLNLADNQVAHLVLGALAGFPFYTVIGIGLGMLIRNQVAALVTGVLWVFVLESMLLALPPLQDVGRWMPAGAAAAFYDTGAATGLGVEYLPVWGAALVLLGYAAATTLVSLFTTLRRDVA